MSIQFPAGAGAAKKRAGSEIQTTRSTNWTVTKASRTASADFTSVDEYDAKFRIRYNFSFKNVRSLKEEIYLMFYFGMGRSVGQKKKKRMNTRRSLGAMKAGLLSTKAWLRGPFVRIKPWTFKLKFVVLFLIICNYTAYTLSNFLFSKEKVFVFNKMSWITVVREALSSVLSIQKTCCWTDSMTVFYGIHARKEYKQLV